MYYVNKVVESENLTQAKLHMAGFNINTIIYSLKIACIALVVLLFLYWYLFTASGYQFRLQGATLDDLLPKKHISGTKS